MKQHMFARQTSDGVSVNESSVCAACLGDDDANDASYQSWLDAEDTLEDGDDTLYPIDNPDGLCNGCGAETLWEDD